MWESQVLLTDGQVIFLRVLRFSPTFDERSARYKWNILERAVKPKSKKKKKKKKKKNSHYFIYIFLTSGVKLHIHLLNVVVQFIVFSLSQLWYVEVRISRSVSVSPLEFEITRVDCTSKTVFLHDGILRVFTDWINCVVLIYLHALNVCSTFVLSIRTEQAQIRCNKRCRLIWVYIIYHSSSSFRHTKQRKEVFRF